MKTLKAVVAFAFLALSMTAFLATAQGTSDGSPSIDDVLSVPYVAGYTVSGTGDVAWVENQRGLRNVFVARAPEYTVAKITGFRDDDGDEVMLMVTTTPGTTK